MGIGEGRYTGVSVRFFDCYKGEKLVTLQALIHGCCQVILNGKDENPGFMFPFNMFSGSKMLQSSYSVLSLYRKLTV